MYVCIVDAEIEIGDDELGRTGALHAGVSSDGSVSESASVLIEVVVPLALWHSSVLLIEKGRHLNNYWSMQCDVDRA